ncbi:NERD domain-containing protein [Rhizobium sp. AB2/73]|uniref:NERD domain-containing protein n=1 Tax=Rhizobium sp. AB2/73 TaxID=2795216 RepID=UPI001C5D6EB6|nr:NERD domain-containing protein [Rhizobium sp. AB2/73]QYA12025.1 NERD domain-containing protein [Rhizobium sp. AB2/73]UEQ82044.1 NERD domain-containing protein [Rhizobium sp. AB2/73]
MISDIANHLEIYIGEPISHRSEEKILKALNAFSSEHKVPLLVLANFELSGRQFDFVIITAGRVVVVEAKSSAFPVRGEINGSWEYATADGQWVPATNGYQQVLQRKNILRDAMMRAGSSFYPEAHVVFSDHLPDGSNLTSGNFKAQVGSLEEFLATLSREDGNPWSVGEWRQWAKHLHLRKVTLLEAFNNTPADLLRKYREAVINDYQPQADEWIPTDDQQRGAIVSALADGVPGVFVTGPSGCGKTLMAKATAVHLARDGGTVLFVQAKDISGSLAEALKMEISLVADMPWSILLKAIRQTGSPAFIILDGINELSEAMFERTLRGIKILARRYSAQLIVISQSERPNLLQGLSIIKVPEPDIDLKKRIAIVLTTSLSDKAVQVLEAARSGLEARMVAELN